MQLSKHATQTKSLQIAIAKLARQIRESDAHIFSLRKTLEKEEKERCFLQVEFRKLSALVSFRAETHTGKAHTETLQSIA